MPPLYNYAAAMLLVQMSDWDLSRMRHLGEAPKDGMLPDSCHIADFARKHACNQLLSLSEMLSGKVGNMATVRQHTVFWDSLRRIQ